MINTFTTDMRPDRCDMPEHRIIGVRSSPTHNTVLEVETPSGDTAYYIQTNSSIFDRTLRSTHPDFDDYEAGTNDGGGWGFFGCNNKSNTDQRNYICIAITLGILLLAFTATMILMFVDLGSSTTYYHAGARTAAFGINEMNAGQRGLLLQGRLIAMEELRLYTQQLYCAMHLQCTRQNAALGTTVDCDYSTTTMAIQCPIPNLPFGPLDVFPTLNYTISAEDVRSVLWKASSSSNDFEREIASFEKHGKRHQASSMYGIGFYSSEADSSSN